MQVAVEKIFLVVVRTEECRARKRFPKEILIECTVLAVQPTGRHHVERSGRKHDILEQAELWDGGGTKLFIQLARCSTSSPIQDT